MILGIVYIIIFIQMSFFWLWYRYLKNPSVVDVGWASGLTLSGFIYLLSEPIGIRTFILAVILFLWGFRLGFYLWYTRIRKGEVDKRYLNLSKNWTIAKPLGFFLNFQLQGILITVIATPWYFASRLPSAHLFFLDYIALIIAIASISAESIADHQLKIFKKNPDSKVCDKGFWKYSRHPNYFFEWLTWCAFSLLALKHPYGWIGIISPLGLYWIMTHITGPMTEKNSLKSRKDAYRKYQKTTPMFFPDLKKILIKK